MNILINSVATLRRSINTMSPFTRYCGIPLPGIITARIGADLENVSLNENIFNRERAFVFGSMIASQGRGVMTPALEYLRWLIHSRVPLTVDDGKRLLQVVAIACLCFIMSVIAYKGFSDISILAQDYPEDFWRALGRYFIDNLAGAGSKNGL